MENTRILADKILVFFRMSKKKTVFHDNNLYISLHLAAQNSSVPTSYFDRTQRSFAVYSYLGGDGVYMSSHKLFQYIY